MRDPSLRVSQKNSSVEVFDGIEIFDQIKSCDSGAVLGVAVDPRQPEDVRRAHIRADDQAGATIGPQAAVLVALQGGLVVRRVVRLVRVSAIF